MAGSNGVEYQIKIDRTPWIMSKSLKDSLHVITSRINSSPENILDRKIDIEQLVRLLLSQPRMYKISVMYQHSLDWLDDFNLDRTIANDVMAIMYGENWESYLDETSSEFLQGIEG